MNADDPLAAAERLLKEFGPTPEEAKFIREQGKALFESGLTAYIQQSGQMRPMALEMAIAYTSFWASDWAQRAQISGK